MSDFGCVCGGGGWSCCSSAIDFDYHPISGWGGSSRMSCMCHHGSHFEKNLRHFTYIEPVLVAAQHCSLHFDPIQLKVDLLCSLKLVGGHLFS